MHCLLNNDAGSYQQPRYNEWGLGAWMLQYKYLRTPNGRDWRYFSFNCEEDAESCNLPDLKNIVFGRVMSDSPSA